MSIVTVNMTQHYTTPLQRPSAEQMMFDKYLFEVPRLSVLTGHFIIRNDVPTDPTEKYDAAELEGEVYPILNQVRVCFPCVSKHMVLRITRRGGRHMRCSSAFIF